MLTRTSLDRYRLHDLLRAYAAERVEAEESTDDRKTFIHRMLGWYLAASYRVYRSILPQGRSLDITADTPQSLLPSFESVAEALAWSELEHANLLDAIDGAYSAGEYEYCWQLAISCMAYLERLSYWNDWVESHEVGLPAAARLD